MLRRKLPRRWLRKRQLASSPYLRNNDLLLKELLRRRHYELLRKKLL